MNVDEHSAELVGILLGDGSLSIYPNINHYRLQITLNSDEKEYAGYIKELFKKIFVKELNIKYRKNENALDLHCFDRKIIISLVDIGLKISPKWDRAIIPEQFMNKTLGKYILRGYFDTDGCIAVVNNNGTKYPRLEMKIMPSPMKKQLLELLDKYNFQYGVYEIGRGKVRVQMNGKEHLEKWSKEIGFSNKKNLDNIYNRLNKS